MWVLRCFRGNSLRPGRHRAKAFRRFGSPCWAPKTTSSAADDRALHHKCLITLARGCRSERKDVQLHKQSRCWTTGRVMGESPDIHGILLGALPAVGGASNLRLTYCKAAAGSPNHLPW